MNTSYTPILSFNRNAESKVSSYIKEVKKEDSYAFYWMNREISASLNQGLIDLDLKPMSKNLANITFEVRIKRKNRVIDRFAFRNGERINK
jgi:hypothetical protein